MFYTGVPDNVRALPDGSGVLVGLFSVFDDEHPILQRSLSTAPLARKFLARLQRLIEIPFEYLNSIYPHIIFQEIVYNVSITEINSLESYNTRNLFLMFSPFFVTDWPLQKCIANVATLNWIVTN